MQATDSIISRYANSKERSVFYFLLAAADLRKKFSFNDDHFPGPTVSGSFKFVLQRHEAVTRQCYPEILSLSPLSPSLSLSLFVLYRGTRHENAILWSRARVTSGNSSSRHFMANHDRRNKRLDLSRRSPAAYDPRSRIARPLH